LYDNYGTYVHHQSNSGGIVVVRQCIMFAVYRKCVEISQRRLCSVKT